MVLKDESASRWLSKWMSEAKKFYITASALTLLSAGCFVVFSWYLSEFAASWLIYGQILPQTAFVCISISYRQICFCPFFVINQLQGGKYHCFQNQKEALSQIAQYSQSDSISSTLLVTRVSDDLKPFFSFFIPYATASVLVGILLLIVCFWFEKWVGIILFISFVSHSLADDNDWRRR
jgi:ATP-binding cassette, subfamily C, bacterial CydD